jgi:hypothetical protein
LVGFDALPDRSLDLTHGVVVLEALPRDAAARDVEAVAIERVSKRPEESLPLSRADPDPRELRARGDVTPACNLPDDVEDELMNVCLFHGSAAVRIRARRGGSGYDLTFA